MKSDGRKAVQRVLERIYKDRLERTGRLPEARVMRGYERKVIEAAERATAPGKGR
jgi:hypothetical protein